MCFVCLVLTLPRQKRYLFNIEVTMTSKTLYNQSKRTFNDTNKNPFIIPKLLQWYKVFSYTCMLSTTSCYLFDEAVYVVCLRGGLSCSHIYHALLCYFSTSVRQLHGYRKEYCYTQRRPNFYDWFISCRSHERVGIYISILIKSASTLTTSDCMNQKNNISNYL